MRQPAPIDLGLVSQNVLAQQNNLARIYFIEAKSGVRAGLETALKQHTEWRKEQGDPWTWSVMQVVNGENLGSYVIRSGEHTWADFDAYDAGFGPKADVHFNATVASLVESASSALTSIDTTNVNWHPNNDAVNLISVTTFHLKPGKGPAFTQAVKGLAKNRCAPASRASCAAPSSRPLTAMMGRLGWRRRSARIVSTPLISGISRSVTTAATGRKMWNTVPTSTSLSTPMKPPWLLTML